MTVKVEKFWFLKMRFKYVARKKIVFINMNLLKKKPDQVPEIESHRQVFTNVVMLEKKDKDFDYMVAPINEQGQEIVSLAEVLKSRVIQEYGAE